MRTLIIVTALVFWGVGAISVVCGSGSLNESTYILRSEMDVGWPVVVRVEPMSDSAGQTAWDPEGGNYIIRIDPQVLKDEAFLRHVLAHEWAHMAVWDAAVQGDHDALWGVAFARAYRILAGE